MVRGSIAAAPGSFVQTSNSAGDAPGGVGIHDHCDHAGDRMAVSFGARVLGRNSAQKAGLDLTSKTVDGERVYRIGKAT
jgi:hypothetical protein